MAPWVRVLEAYLVAALLRTPAFHRGVEKVARQVHRLRHGTPPEEMGGMKIDDPQHTSFVQRFADEIKTQLTGQETKKTGGVNMDHRVFDSHHVKSQSGQNVQAEAPESKEDAESVWKSSRETPPQQPNSKGFVSDYMDALRDQVRNNKRGG